MAMAAMARSRAPETEAMGGERFLEPGGEGGVGAAPVCHDRRLPNVRGGACEGALARFGRLGDLGIEGQGEAGLRHRSLASH